MRMNGDSDSNLGPSGELASASKSLRARRPFLLMRYVVLLLVAGLIYTFTSVYSIQPIGALPNGATVIVWRTTGAPFFDSPDAMCLRLAHEVSLMCRAIALAKGPAVNYKIVSLPYMPWAYELSTGGKVYDR